MHVICGKKLDFGSLLSQRNCVYVRLRVEVAEVTNDLQKLSVEP